MGEEQRAVDLRVPTPVTDPPSGARAPVARPPAPVAGGVALHTGSAPGAAPPARARGPVRGAARPRSPRAPRATEPAPERPVARVAVDVPLAHLDRPFDYLVTAEQHEQVVPGSRVRVRFAGQQVAGLVLERVASSDHSGVLAPLARAVSPEPVLTAEVAGLARAVADRWAGSLADVLRLAVPPRHARVEAAARRSDPDAAGGPPPATAKPGIPVLTPQPETPVPAAPPPSAAVPAATRPPAPDPGSWARYDTGSAFLAALADGRSPRAVWTALPGPSWPDEIARAVAATLAGGRGAVVVVPDARDVERVDAALSALLGAGHHVALRADLGPAERYRRFLAVSRGVVQAVVGTRAAVFAPVRRLGLVVVWDDGDDLHAEPRAPYPHARDVLLLRAARARAAALVGGPVRTAEGQLLLDDGWARALTAPRASVRAASPRVEPAGGELELERDPAARSARLPRLALAAAREALAAGAPVLVQVPRRGYVPGLACDRCRSPARCPHCAGPLGVAAGAPDGGRVLPSCRWCARPAAAWTCPVCSGVRLRAAVVGARRTAEELGRAFPGAVVLTSGRDSVLATVGAGPALVVATPGAEPVAEGGYGAALLLDGWALLGRPDLRAAEEALRRWATAAALVRPAPDGGRVVLMADAGVPAVQALVRGDPAGVAPRELADRRELCFPPVVRLASVEGPPDEVADLLAAAELPAGAEPLGPVPVPVPPGRPGPAGGDAGDVRERVLLRVPRAEGTALAAGLRVAQARRSARKAPPVRVQLDPAELL